MKLSFLSLFLSVISLGWGIWNRVRANEAETRLENVRNSHYRFVDQTREQFEKLQSELVALRRELRTRDGGTLFYPEMTVQEAIEIDPRAADLMSALHIGGCSDCAVGPQDTLRHAAEGNGKSVEQLLQILNRLPQATDQELQQLLERRPNVQISL